VSGRSSLLFMGSFASAIVEVEKNERESRRKRLGSFRGVRRLYTTLAHKFVTVPDRCQCSVVWAVKGRNTVRSDEKSQTQAGANWPFCMLSVLLP
jgi:ribosomal protein S11